MLARLLAAGDRSTVMDQLSPTRLPDLSWRHVSSAGSGSLERGQVRATSDQGVDDDLTLRWSDHENSVASAGRGISVINEDLNKNAVDRRRGNELRCSKLGMDGLDIGVANRCGRASRHAG